MAWQIVKISFGVLRSRFKQFIIPCVIAFLLILLDIFFLNKFPLLSPIPYVGIAFFTEIPFFIMFFEKNVLQCLRKNWFSFLATAVIYSLLLIFVQYIFSTLDIDSSILTYNGSLIILSVCIGSLWAEIIKNDLNAKNAATAAVKTFSKNKLQNIWLLIKLVLIETLGVIAVGLILSIIMIPLLFAPEISQSIQSIAILLILGVLLLFLYPYLAIRTCCYYETISQRKK